MNLDMEDAMPLLEIDEDVYQYLLSRAVRIGEGGSAILRRELGLPEPNNGGGTQAGGGAEGNGSKPAEVKAVEELLVDPGFRTQRVVTKKYLRLLGLLAELHADEFELVLDIRGRQRLYFGRSQQEIARSGKSLHPRKIPGTEYWAMTNADTAHKQDIMAEALKVLGYPKDTIQQVRRALN
jgi:negative modulator of initiation of replication